jgi:hypothetical protein
MDGIGTGLAIAGAIVTTGKVIKQIKDFITDSKTVDESVKGFLNEVEALQSVLGAIKNSFADIGSLYRWLFDPLATYRFLPFPKIVFTTKRLDHIKSRYICSLSLEDIINLVASRSNSLLVL